MFGHLTSGRFGAEKDSAVGPGSYDLPTTLDEHGVTLVGPERFQETDLHEGDSSLLDISDHACESKPKVRVQNSCAAKKDLNVEEAADSTCRATPTPARSQREPRVQTPKGKGTSTTFCKVTYEKGSPDRREVEVLKRQLAHEEKLRREAEARINELKTARKAGTEAHSTSQARERKLEELHKRCEDLARQKSEAHKRACDLEQEKSSRQKALHERDETVAALQKSLDHTRVQFQELRERVGRIDPEAVQERCKKLEVLVEQGEAKREAEEVKLKKAEERSAALAQQLEEMEAQCCELKEHAAQAEIATTEKDDARLSELQDQLRKQELDFQATDEELTVAKARCKVFMDQVEQQKSCIASKDAALEEAAQNVADAMAKAAEVSAVKVQELQTLQVQLDDLLRRAEKAEAHCKDLTESAEHGEADAAAAARKLQEAESQCAELQARVELSEADAAATGLAIEDIQQRCKQLEERAERGEADKAVKAEQIGVLQAQCEELRERAEKSDADAALKTGKVYELETRCQALHKRAEEGETAAVAEAEELEKCRGEVAAKAAEIEQLEMRCLELLDRAKRGEASAATKAEELEEQARHNAASSMASSLVQNAIVKGLFQVVEHDHKDEEGTRNLIVEEVRELRELLQTSEQGRELDRGRLVELEQEQLAVAHQCAEFEVQAHAAKAELADSHRAQERLRNELEKLQFAKKEAAMFCNAKERAEDKLKDLVFEVERWQQKAEGVELDDERLKRQDEELNLFARQCEELRMQNRELMLSMQHFKQDWERSDAENRELKETLAVFEANLERAADQNAQLMGHANPKQKIRHTIKLKEENSHLREQLKKARQRVTRMEVSRVGESLLDALAPFSRGLAAEAASGPAAGRAGPRTPGKAPATGRTSPRQSCGGPGPSPRDRASGQAAAISRGRTSCVMNNIQDRAELRVAEAERRCAMQERAMERVRVDFAHFTSLIERAVCFEEADGENHTMSDSLGVSQEALLERLRKIAKVQLSAANPLQGVASEPRTPRMALWPDPFSADNGDKSCSPSSMNGLAPQAT